MFNSRRTRQWMPQQQQYSSRSRALAIDVLETRRLLAVTTAFTEGVLIVTGDAAANDLQVTSVQQGGNSYVVVKDGNTTIYDGVTEDVLASAVMHISVNAGGGADTIDLSDVTSTHGFASQGSTFTTLDGKDGADTIIGSQFDDLIFGGADDDVIFGNEGHDDLIAGEGDDMITGGGGDDIYRFAGQNNGSDMVIEAESEGHDWLDFGQSPSPLTLSLDSSEPQSWGSGTITLDDPAAFEHVFGTTFSDFIYGNDRPNYLIGGEGTDTLIGHGGSDALFGGLDDDRLSGGNDSDLLAGNAGVDWLSGDLGDDLLLAADVDFPQVEIVSLRDITAVIDSLMGAWTANYSIADRVANMMGHAGAIDPLPEVLQLIPGVSLINDEEVDYLNSAAGNDVVFLDSRADTVMTDDTRQAIFVEVDPTWDLLEADFDEGRLTISYRGGGDLVYSVVDGNLLVNGSHPWGAPLLAEEVLQVMTQLDSLAGDLVDDVLVSGALPNIELAAYTRTATLSASFFTAETIDDTLTAIFDASWPSLTSYSAEDIADACNAGNYALIWEVICAGNLAAGAQQAMMGPTTPTKDLQTAKWYEISDAVSSIKSAILADSPGGGMSAMSGGDGDEGGFLDIGDIDQQPVSEGDLAKFPLSLSPGYYNGFTVDFMTQEITAKPGLNFRSGDYFPAVGTISWLDAGEGGTGEVSVPTFSDFRMEDLEYFYAKLTNLVNHDGDEGDAAIRKPLGLAAIEDTSTLPAATIAPASAFEGSLLRLPVTLSHPLQEGTVTIHWVAEDITTEGASDYTPASGSITFAPLTPTYIGDTLKYIEINTINDDVHEPSETLRVRLTEGTNVIVPTAAQTAGTIVDNDLIPSMRINDVMLDEWDGQAIFTVSLNRAAEHAITVNWQTSNGSAVAPQDYQTNSGTLTIPGGSLTGQITVTVVNDNIYEPNETFWVHLSPPQGALMVDATGQALIRDMGVDIDTDSNNDGFINAADDPASDPTFEEGHPGKILRYNDDDDNGNLQPDRTDPAPFKLPNGNPAFDNDLAPAVITYLGAPRNGYKIEIDDAAVSSSVKLWQSLDKQPLKKTYVIGTDTLPVTIYAEGYEPGVADVEVILRTPEGAEIRRDKVRFVVVRVDLSVDNDTSLDGANDGVARYWPGYEGDTAKVSTGTTFGSTVYQGQEMKIVAEGIGADQGITSVAFTILQVTNYEGFAGNFTDAKITNPASGPTRDDDYSFAELVDDRDTLGTMQAGRTWATFWAKDYGGKAVVQVQFKKGSVNVYTFDLVVPLDTDSDGLADSWERAEVTKWNLQFGDSKPFDNSSFNASFDGELRDPDGANMDGGTDMPEHAGPGDSLTALQEYRGYIVDGGHGDAQGHKRLSPAYKELLVETDIMTGVPDMPAGFEIRLDMDSVVEGFEDKINGAGLHMYYVIDEASAEHQEFANPNAAAAWANNHRNLSFNVLAGDLTNLADFQRQLVLADIDNSSLLEAGASNGSTAFVFVSTLKSITAAHGWNLNVGLIHTAAHELTHTIIPGFGMEHLTAADEKKYLMYITMVAENVNTILFEDLTRSRIDF